MMVNLRLLTTVLIGFTSCLYTFSRDISVTHFGAVPDDGKNDADALRQAAKYCREHAGTTLIWPAGIYNFRDEKAVEIERKALSGQYGNWAQTQSFLFRHDGPYVIALDFRGSRNLTIKASGATLLMEGWTEVISLVGTRHIQLEGLTITYKRPAATVGRIVRSSETDFEMEFDPQRYLYLDSVASGRVHFFNSQRERIYSGGGHHMEVLSPGRVRMESNTHPAVGDYCILRQGGHYRPCIMIKDSRDVVLRNVRLMGHCGMGVVGHLSKDILLDGLQVVPEQGNISSTNTDATHFTSCSGLITLQNCMFKGQGDDCTNIHNYYYHYYPQDDGWVEIRIEGADLHALSLDFPEKGDTMLVLNRSNMHEKDRYVVERVDTNEQAWRVRIKLNKPIDKADANNYYMYNVTRMPRIHLFNNTVYSHLGRAFLLKSNKEIIIRGNKISGCSLSAIKLGGEISWQEAGPVNNVLIENNYISGCNGSGGPDEGSCVRLCNESPQTPPFVNRNITIRNNVFDSEQPTVILLQDAENVLIENNIVNRQHYVRQINCQNVVVKE